VPVLRDFYAATALPLWISFFSLGLLTRAGNTGGGTIHESLKIIKLFSAADQNILV
jgi:hypothetical protein